MLQYDYYLSPLGLIEIAASEAGIKALRFTSKKVRRKKADSPFLKSCVEQLSEYFDGSRKYFDLPLDMRESSSFYREVWNLVRSIPYGRTRTYSDIAQHLGRSGANRAVGQANGHNPMPIIIPCHRVIGKGGDLRGYAHGLKIKEALLKLENPEGFAEQQELFTGDARRAVSV